MREAACISACFDMPAPTWLRNMPHCTTSIKWRRWKPEQLLLFTQSFSILILGGFSSTWHVYCMLRSVSWTLCELRHVTHHPQLTHYPSVSLLFRSSETASCLSTLQGHLQQRVLFHTDAASSYTLQSGERQCTQKWFCMYTTALR